MALRVSCEAPEYELLELLGAGLSGCVYKAIRRDSQGHSEQIVALKILKSLKRVSWLRKEFDSLIKIRTEACVRLLAWENLDQGPALVMEYVEGFNLHDLKQNVSLSSHVAREIFAQVRVGVQELHAEGHCHGDLQPANIMVGRNGQVKLIDFARAPDEDDARIGTLDYLSPRRQQGFPPSYEDDLFALEVIGDELGLEREGRFKAQSDIAGRFCLAEVVQGLEKTKKRPATKTQVLFTRKMSLWTNAHWWLQEMASLPRFMGVFVGLLCLSAASNSNPNTFLPLSRLEVRSHFWVHLQLNGRDAGYAPIDLPALSPGPHHLRWCRARQCGSIRFELQQGQTLRLTDLHFK